MHLLAAIISGLAVILYGIRSGHLAGNGGIESRWALVARVALGLWMVSNVTGFLDLHDKGAAFEPRHEFVFLAMLGVVVAYVGLWVVRTQPVPMIPAQRLLDLIDGADHPSHGEPCTHPGCAEARIEIRRLADSAHVVHH